MAGFSLGGHCALISLFCLSANPSREKNVFMTTKILASSILLCALVALLARVMSPHLVNVETTRVLAIERLLANGRAPMTLQLFTMIISYSNLLLTCSFDLLMSAHLLKLTIPGAAGLGLCGRQRGNLSGLGAHGVGRAIRRALPEYLSLLCSGAAGHCAVLRSADKAKKEAYGPWLSACCRSSCSCSGYFR